jgi:uncharacterized protein
MRVLSSIAVAAMLLMPATAVVADAGIEAVGPSGALRGSLVSVSSEAPVVLIVPGSGPTDRDGNNRLGLSASTYRLIAEGLAAKGVASVRIDKRGMFGSAGAVPDPNAVTISDYAADVASWIAAIRSATKRECVWVLGHSEGGLVALAAAQKNIGICGLLLAATAGRPLSDVLSAQLKSNPANAPILEQAQTAIDALKTGTRFDPTGLHPGLMPLFRPQVQGFLIDAFSYDPIKLIGGYGGPVLILQGGRDIQVGVADAELLARAKPEAKLVIIPEANHVLKQVTSDDRSANLATYANPNLPLVAGIADALAVFVKSQK